MTGRYSEELVEGGFAVEVADAPLLHAGLNVADLAHVLVLRERGVVPDAAARRLLGVLLDAVDTPVAEFGYDPRHGEVYNCRERRFVARIGHDAGWLHAGRPRREAVRIALRLRVRRDTVDLIEAAARFALAAARMADAHAETVMADQTYLQHAQPSTFGHYLLGAPTRCCATSTGSPRPGLDQRSPAGAGGVNGSPLIGDRQRMADLLGFDGVIEHTRDAMWQADGLHVRGRDGGEPGHHAGQARRGPGDLGSGEFGYLSLADGHTRSSVLMPQKRNPYALSMVRGESGMLSAGPPVPRAGQEPVGAQRQPDLRLRRGAARAGPGGRATRLMAGVVGRLRVDADRMYAALESGFAQAADLAEYLMVSAGLDYRSAYDLVGVCVRRAAAAGLRGVDITGEMLDAAAAELAAADPDRPARRVRRRGSVHRARSAGDRAVPELARWRGPGRGARHGRGLPGRRHGRARRRPRPARRLRAGRGRGAAAGP